jgi:hypothetical protein
MRIKGTILSEHPIQSGYGSYGELVADDGRAYVWSNREVYRDGTEMHTGKKVYFEADPHHSYARNISKDG